MMGYSFFPSERSTLLTQLTHQDDKNRTDVIFAAAQETGGTFGRTRTTHGRDVCLIILHGITAKGARQADAVRDWIRQASNAELTKGARR